MDATSTGRQGHEVIELRSLTDSQAAKVRGLADIANDADGAHPLSESVLLNLLAKDRKFSHLLIKGTDGGLAGYAHLHTLGNAVSAEAVIHPGSRRRGFGRLLIATSTEVATRAASHPDTSITSSGAVASLRIWAHGDHPSAAALAVDLGFERARVLWQLRRSLVEPLPEHRLPAGVALRAFRPGADDAAWLRVNSRAFADHPEQGRWALEDLAVRFTEPWFDPAGFLLAVEQTSGRLLGFHWTKVHDASPADSGTPIGEVYVLGVDPDLHGSGLGRALALAGLHHLRDRGLSRAMLYVDESNSAAMALYRRLGFAPWTANVHYHRPI